MSESEEGHLRGVDQTLEKRSQSNFIVKNDHVQVSNGSQMHEVRKVAGAKSQGLGIKRWRWDARPLRMMVFMLSSHAAEK